MPVRIQLPFSMGKVTYPDPNTFEPVFDHPILDIGSSYSSVKSEVLEWLSKHCDDQFDVGFTAGGYYIDFPTESAMILFVLRWS